MENEKTKSRLIYALTLVLLALTLTGCQTKSRPDKSTVDVQEGGLYITKDSAGVYSVSKVLVVDNDNNIVHVRLYRDTFLLRPKTLNSDSLHILVGHSPIDKKGFLANHPELIETEEVKEEELEGYKVYLNAMGK